MRAALLHLDDALTGQSRLREAVRAGGGATLDSRGLGPELRLWSRPAGLRRLRDQLAAFLPAEAGAALVFSGSGDFHHVTPLLLGRALSAHGDPPVTVLHFDNHPDWVKFGPGAHCGSWVGQVARMDRVARVVTVGVCSSDIQAPAAKGADLRIVEDGKVELYAYHAEATPDAVTVCGRRWPTIEAMGEAAFADFLPTRIATEAVYITIDKDVLRPADAGTNWDQGRMSLGFLKTLIASALQSRRLIGADVVGDWSAASYGGGLLPSMLKRAEAALDQPWRAPAPAILAGNEAVNLALLDQILAVAR
ncbi:MAG: arginase family protein [Alphaproteobacteria bacterium]|nr:arginase family protein [Alphaproteobacteria bacterium]MBU1516431.1 arginase family protein [Alphaproteobacteria bacterium]MBU2093332.1 arginase family protein [Alphaproteobacteria bacterium]MBU2153819.1 arginase family protein [Alphaproteobacteria bacterium]MBU2307691.1 arginase family protein [Alphaproteobacteria bacterium]